MYKNETKHRRAIADCGPDATEEQIKARYLELGGLYVEEEGVEEEVETEEVETPSEEEETESAEEMTTEDVGPASTDQAPVEEEAPAPRGRGRRS